MKPNPPIPGHELLYEGHSYRTYGSDEMYNGDHDGGCRCGAKPDGWPNLSIGAVKRWHREHKAALR